MKRTNIKSFLFGITVLFTFSACESWLDATPKSQIKEEDHFSREIGYKDQLTGVYSAMCSESMYGLQMGIGFTEILSQNYNVDGNNQTWRYAADYDYKNSACESIINNIWSNTYNCIANLNVLLKNIEKADPNMFEENHYALFHVRHGGVGLDFAVDLVRESGFVQYVRYHFGGSYLEQSFVCSNQCLVQIEAGQYFRQLFTCTGSEVRHFV